MIEINCARNKDQHSIGTNNGHSLLFSTRDRSTSEFSQGKTTHPCQGNGRYKNEQPWPNDEAFQVCDGLRRTKEFDHNRCREKCGNAESGNRHGKPMEHEHHGILRSDRMVTCCHNMKTQPGCQHVVKLAGVVNE